MSDTITTYDAMLKQYYSDDKVMNLIYDKNPFLTMVEKDEGFVGDTYKVPVIFSGNAAVVSSFSLAQAQSQANSQGTAAFLVSSRAKLYGVTNWTRETMLASASDAGAFMSVAKTAVENILRDMGNQLATSAYRSGYGDQGQIATGTSVTGKTLQLQNAEDIVNYVVGMQLDASLVQGGAIRVEGTNPLTVTGVDRSNGILTFGFNVNDATNGIPTIAAGDFLYVRGNAANGSTAQLMFGIESWIPATTPATTDSFWSVNRSQDTRLSGNRLNGTGGQPLEEILIDAAELVGREGGTLSHFFMSFGTFSRLLKQMQGRVILTDVSTDAGIGFRGATVQTPTGEILCVPDRTCPANRIYGLELSSWKLATLQKMVAPVEEDGLMILRQSNADAFESRYAFYGQLVCKAPSHNINIQVSAS